MQHFFSIPAKKDEIKSLTPSKKVAKVGLSLDGLSGDLTGGARRLFDIVGRKEMHSVPQSYEVEWEDHDDVIHVMTVMARSASKAEDKATAKLRQKPEFRKIIHVELYP